jgi:quercetin dioxygenase-like cupin family protein
LRLLLSRVGSLSAPVAPDSVVYGLESGVAAFGEAVAGQALVWRIDDQDADADGTLLSGTFAADATGDWIVRCDRVDFPPGGIAHRHVHPGPGIRYLLHGEIAIETEGATTVYGPGGAWFESGPEPVVARASTHEETSFVRVLVLPAEWAGKRTITYLDPVPETTPRQSATVLLERPIVLPS